MEFKISGPRATEHSHPARLPIGLRLRQLREQRGFSQADIEQRAGLLRCYISRVENGYKLPSLRTLERFAFALDVPLYRLFYDGEEPPPTPRLTLRVAFEDLLKTEDEGAPNTRLVRKLGRLWGQLGHFEHQLVLNAAMWLGTRSRGAAGKNTCQGVRFSDQGRAGGDGTRWAIPKSRGVKDQSR
jgi:transcriptional regulator with XRE-family HTH domain